MILARSTFGDLVGALEEFLEPLIESGRSAGSPVLRVFGDYAFAAPWYLVIAPLALALMFLVRRGRGAARTGGLPSVVLPRTLRQRSAFVVPLARVVAVVLFAVALARPLRTDAETADSSEGVDILLIVDRSTSMQLRDMEGELGSGRMRIDVVREVALDFARRRMTDRGYARDAVGLMGFAGFPELICPFTLDVDALTGFEDRLDIVNSEEDGTRIGAALTKGVQLMQGSDAKSKVIVLLSDGEETRGPVITPLQAAEFAAKEGVTVYTILAGRYKLAQTFGQIMASSEELDPTEMRAIAERAGGTFYRARDREELEGIYERIEELERTPRETQRMVEAFDLYPPFLLAALLLYALAWCLESTTFRRTLP
ncbi:von Willebrand factor type A domain protein [Planctomycetes bacterium Pla163]|uniref:von Willebrand factor type A domain protein n=1 Tax=Rohdeia mirabilis TaxID=2528008 RepID=A0A518D202_9BACT|nr:von Willebrand factor type A domain protein [Planctomycetes bacterium Pla163]